MHRTLALILLVAVPAFAQDLIHGTVTDATTGKPIAGATVHYRGTGGAFGENHQVLDPPNLAGQVITASDGSYTLPPLPPGPFYVRAFAPGYLYVRKSLDTVKSAYPPPPGFPIQSDDFQLQPSHDLAEMNAAGLPAAPSTAPNDRSFLQSVTLARFNPDGTELLLAIPPFYNHPAQLWIYNLSARTMRQIQIPAEFGNHSIEQLGWDGTNILFASENEYSDQPGFIGSVTLPSLEAKLLPTPKPFQFSVSINPPPQPDPVHWRADYEEIDCNPTGDPTSTACHGPTTQLVVYDEWRHRTLRFGVDFEPTYILDGLLNLFFYKEEDSTYHYHIVEQNLATGQKLSLQLASDGYADPAITLLAMTPLRNPAHGLDGFRVAYRTNGNCDPESIEQPPNFGSGYHSDPQYWQQPAPASICFITMPVLPPPPPKPAPRPATPSSAKKKPAALSKPR